MAREVHLGSTFHDMEHNKILVKMAKVMISIQLQVVLLLLGATLVLWAARPQRFKSTPILISAPCNDRLGASHSAPDENAMMI